MKLFDRSLQFVGFCILATMIHSDVLGQCGPTTVEIVLEPECFEVGEVVVGTIELSNADHLISGGQFFIEYNPVVFGVLGLENGDDPFNFTLFSDTSTAGLIDYSVVVFPPSNMGTANDSTMAVIQFLIVGDGGDPFVRFRLHDPPSPTQLLTSNGGLIPLLRNPSSDALSLRELSDFQNCFTAQDGSSPAECRCQFDVEGDNDLDGEDYHFFLEAFVGPSDADCE